MKSRIGKHEARLVAAKAEPSPITALRDMLATAYAADIAAVTPMVCEMMCCESTARAVSGGDVRRAAEYLGEHAGVLALEVVQTFRALFDAKLVAGRDSFAARVSATSMGLALMDETMLQIELAVDQCAARLKEQSAAEMFQLTARVAAMLGKTSLGDAENPVLPRVFVRALAQSLEKLSLDNEQRLAVLKSFRPPLLHIAPDLYNHANELLIGLGVMADFSAGYGRPVVTESLRPARAETLIADEKTLSLILDRLLTGGRSIAPMLVAP